MYEGQLVSMIGIGISKCIWNYCKRYVYIKYRTNNT